MTREEDYQLSRSMRKEPLEDRFIPATGKQLMFIEQLRLGLGYSERTCDEQISVIINRDVPNDGMWLLSRSEASKVIDKFKQWKEERK